MQLDDADEDLMVAYQKGEVRAFEILLHRHRKPVFNFMLRYLCPIFAAIILASSVANALGWIAM